jgi:hypothetical protein
MRQLTFTLLCLIAIASALFAAGPRQAYACFCAGILPTKEFAKQVAESSDLLVVGEVLSHGFVAGAVPTPFGATPASGEPQPDRDVLRYGNIRATVAVERAYGRYVPYLVEIITDDGGGGCGYGASLQQGGRHFMALRSNGGSNTYNASYCSSFSMAGVDAPGAQQTSDYSAFLDELAKIAPPTHRNPPFTNNEGFEEYARYLLTIQNREEDQAGPSPWIIVAYATASVGVLAALTGARSRLRRQT